MRENDARLGWIEASLRYVGRFASREKRAMQEAFGISESTASRDQSKFLMLFSERTEQDVVEKKGGKLYLRSGATMPDYSVFAPPDLKTWLAFRLGSKHVSVTGFGRAMPSASVLEVVLKGIEERRPIAMTYISKTAGSEHHLRNASPHSLVDVAGRYHMRAYDHEKARFSDFVLSRVAWCSLNESGDPEYVDISHDRDWHTREIVEISCSGDVSREAIMRDYGLDQSGLRHLPVAAAISPYVIDSPPAEYASPVRMRRCGPLGK